MGSEGSNFKMPFPGTASDGLQRLQLWIDPSQERARAMARFTDWGRKYRMRRRKALTLDFFLGFHTRWR